MEKPVYLNLHSWDDYAIYRSLRTLPIPSPRVWDNARRFGWSKGNYKKDRFFDESLFTHELSIGTKKMFGGDLMMFNHFSGCPPSNLESKKNKSKEFSKLLLNLEKFERSKLIRIPLDFDAMNQAVKRIYSIFPRKEDVNSDFIDVGFCAEEELELEYQEKGTSEYNWTYLNDLLDEELIAKNKITIEKFYEIFEASFNYPSVELKEIGRTLENDYWFIEMFLYSFRPKIFESIMREKIIPEILNSSPLTSDQTSSFDYEGSDAYKLLKFEKPHLFKDSALKEFTLKESPLNESPEGEMCGLKFIPSYAQTPEGFLSLGDDVKNLKFALNNPKISFRSFFNDLDFLIDGIWVEDTLYAPAFDETLFCKMVRDEARKILAQENQKRTEEINKASQRGMNIGAVIGLAATFAGWINEADTSNSAMTTMMLSNTIGRSESLRAQNEIEITGDVDFDDPYLIFKNDPGSYISISESCKTTSIKRRICLRKKFLENGKIYFDLLPMILFGNLATPAQVIKLDNEYFLRPISAGFCDDFNSNLKYNPLKIRRSYSYNPRTDISKVAKILTTKIVGETIEKTPTINHAWFDEDESLNHFYFDYSTDGSIF